MRALQVEVVELERRHAESQEEVPGGHVIAANWSGRTSDYPFILESVDFSPTQATQQGRRNHNAAEEPPQPKPNLESNQSRTLKPVCDLKASRPMRLLAVLAHQVQCGLSCAPVRTLPCLQCRLWLRLRQVSRAYGMLAVREELGQSTRAVQPSTMHASTCEVHSCS